MREQLASRCTCSGAADPDLTIHLGHITLDGCESPDELRFARGLLQAWPAPVVCTPANHDIGTGSGEEPLSRVALSRYTAPSAQIEWDYMHLTPPGAVRHERTGLSFYRELMPHA